MLIPFLGQSVGGGAVSVVVTLIVPPHGTTTAETDEGKSTSIEPRITKADRTASATFGDFLSIARCLIPNARPSSSDPYLGIFSLDGFYFIRKIIRGQKGPIDIGHILCA
jgi:hypothetical protein